MLRYRCWAWLGLVLLAPACSIPSARDNASAAASLVEGKLPAPLLWRRDPDADRLARERVEELLEGGLSVEEAINVAFLASPSLQLAFEQLEISRAELVAATRPSNPVVIAGARQPGGDLADYYPDQTISFGVLQNLISLLSIPDRRAHAMRNLERVRLEVAQQASTLAAQVAESWYATRAAEQIVALHERSVATARAAQGAMAVAAANREVTDLEAVEWSNVALAAESDLDRARLEAAGSRAELASLMAIAGWRDDWQLAGGLPALPATDPDAVVLEAAAMQRRFDMRAARKTVEMRLRQLASQRRFRWINDFEIGVFRDKAIGGTSFTGPNVAFGLPVFDQRQAALLQADAELQSATRQLEAVALEARRQIRSHAQEVAAMRRVVERHERELLPNHERMVTSMGGGLSGELLWLKAQRERWEALRDYWVARSALAHAAGDWLGLAGVP